MLLYVFGSRSRCRFIVSRGSGKRTPWLRARYFALHQLDHQTRHSDESPANSHQRAGHRRRQRDCSLKYSWLNSAHDCLHPSSEFHDRSGTASLRASWLRRSTGSTITLSSILSALQVHSALPVLSITPGRRRRGPARLGTLLLRPGLARGGHHPPVVWS
jgi:hypothetical protein